MMKKVYINPTTKLVYMDPERILAGTGNGNPQGAPMYGVDADVDSEVMSDDDDDLWD